TLFLTDRFKTTDYFGTLNAVCPELAACAPGKLIATECPRLRRVVSIKEEKSPGMFAWGEFLTHSRNGSEEELDRHAAAVQAGDVVNIQYTSGTTGFPKGAMLTHRNLLMNGYYVGQRMAFGERDRLCSPVPLYHCFGCVLGVLTCAVYGAAMVVPAESFDPLATLQAI